MIGFFQWAVVIVALVAGVYFAMRPKIENGGLKVALKKSGIVFAVVLLCISVVASWGIGILEGPASVPGKVMDGDRILYTYEWFFNKYYAIQAYEPQVANAKVAVEQFKSDHEGRLDSYVNSTELSRLQSVLLGLRNQMARAVEDYNAAAMNDTRQMFRDNELPQKLVIIGDKVFEN